MSIGHGTAAENDQKPFLPRLKKSINILVGKTLETGLEPETKASRKKDECPTNKKKNTFSHWELKRSMNSSPGEKAVSDRKQYLLILPEPILSLKIGVNFWEQTELPIRTKSIGLMKRLKYS